MRDSARELGVVRPGRTYEGRQGITYGAGASRGTVGAARLCMNVMPMPAGARAKAHYHAGVETIAYLLDGACEVHWGDRLQHVTTLEAGDQAYVPADLPHAPLNHSGAPCTWLVVHGSGDDQDGIVMLPELDAVLAAKRPLR
jgi:uncharacterized RmlC-like cupin family protein